jgi:diaminopimelate epimerase
MYIDFYKFHGTGNDFILIDNRTDIFSASAEQIAALCHRRFGIGADGLMLLNANTDFAFEMKYFNSDGRPSTMCGNGGRCIVAFAAMLGIVNAHVEFLAPDGAHQANILSATNSSWMISLQMADVDAIQKVKRDYILNTGSPHFVRFVNDVSAYEVFDEGRSVRYYEEYCQEGINVNFVSAFEDGIFVRTYERGVEDETLSCGTGVTAASIAWSKAMGLPIGLVKVHTLGGDLKVAFDQVDGAFKNVSLEGPAQFVFKGHIELP